MQTEERIILDEDQAGQAADVPSPTLVCVEILQVLEETVPVVGEDVHNGLWLVGVGNKHLRIGIQNEDRDGWLGDRKLC